jgi:hypothetical protein
LGVDGAVEIPRWSIERRPADAVRCLRGAFTNTRAAKLYACLGYRRHPEMPYVSCAAFDEDSPTEKCHVMVKELSSTRAE